MSSLPPEFPKSLLRCVWFSPKVDPELYLELWDSTHSEERGGERRVLPLLRRECHLPGITVPWEKSAGWLALCLRDTHYIWLREGVENLCLGEVLPCTAIQVVPHSPTEAIISTVGQIPGHHSMCEWRPLELCIVAPPQ